MTTSINTSVIALDYSRPIETLLAQASHITQPGVVHSIFRRAVNLSLGHTMLTLLSSELPRMPNGVHIPAGALQTLVRQLEPGMPVFVGNREVSIPACHYVLRLPQTAAWEPRPEVAGHHWRRELIEQHVGTVARYLADQARHDQQDGLAPLVGPLLLGQPVEMTPLFSTALPPLRLLMRAGWQQDMADLEAATRSLAGLGAGLTPSGDDVLGGFAAIMTLLSPYASADLLARQHIAQRIAAIACPRTTTISAVLLAHAARGEVAEPVKAWLLALPAESRTGLMRLTDHVLSIGSTSGGDLLLGLLLGLHTLMYPDALTHPDRNN